MTRLLPHAMLAIAILFALPSSLSAFGPCCCFCQEGRCQVKVEKEEIETKEFVCECKTICIPPLRFPWECGPLKKCGKVRQVKKLGSEKGKATVCTYDWTAVHCCPSCRVKVRMSCGCGNGSHGECGGGSCCDQPVAIDFDCAQIELPTPANMTADHAANATEAYAAESAAFAQRYPEVSVAMIDAIRTTTPDADGWVSLSNHTSQSLTAEVELIEATE